MKHTLYLVSFLLLTLTACKKDDTSKPTKVDVMVTDNTGAAQSNFTVYQISDTKFNLYGADPFFRDQQSVTTTSGVASFTLDDLDFNTGGQRTYYYYCKYMLGGTDKTKSVGVTLSKGDTKTISLQLN